MSWKKKQTGAGYRRNFNIPRNLFLSVWRSGTEERSFLVYASNYFSMLHLLRSDAMRREDLVLAILAVLLPWLAIAAVIFWPA